MAEALDGAVTPGIDELTRFVLRQACDQELRLVTAESCTGGLLASLLTDIPGCSHAFERGFVVYTDEAKHELLGVPVEILERYGAVSEACARAMAQGALERSRGDLALAVTGYTEAGPDGEPAGLVHFASARRGEPVDHQLHRFGELGRAEARLRCLEVALRMLRARLISKADAA